jgi:copper chaperone CopZ
VILPTKRVLSGVALVWLLLTARPVCAEYLKIRLKVYGLDCQLCARGVSKSIERIAGVQSVDVSLKTGVLEVTLTPGNTFRMSDLRKRIKENGFRSMEATVTAVGQARGSKFEIAGIQESYDLGSRTPATANPVELTFEVR